MTKIRTVLEVVMFCALVGVPALGTAAQQQTGDFEGVYAVGTTTCVVTAVQMAFEVRWAGNSTPEFYIYDPQRSQGNTVAFSTDPSYTPGPVKTFYFDSRTVLSGTFDPGNGSRLPVHKQADLPGFIP